MTKLNISISFKNLYIISNQVAGLKPISGRGMRTRGSLSCDMADRGIYPSGTLRLPLAFVTEKEIRIRYPFRRHFSTMSTLVPLLLSADHCCR